jgi:hypothetical protein
MVACRTPGKALEDGDEVSVRPVGWSSGGLPAGTVPVALGFDHHPNGPRELLDLIERDAGLLEGLAARAAELEDMELLIDVRLRSAEVEWTAA